MIENWEFKNNLKFEAYLFILPLAYINHFVVDIKNLFQQFQNF